MVRQLPFLAPLLLAGIPGGVGAADWPSAELHRYGSSSGQVSSIQQFEDVRTGDWAYQALMQLIERHGCVQGYRAGTWGGQRALSRYEAAALLNACLVRITERTDELRALLGEFGQELAVLKGRVDGLEARVGELEAMGFSTTTRLAGQATLVLGGNGFSGSASELVKASRGEFGATSLDYDLQLTLDTSFSGKDLLRTNLRAGNFGRSSFGSAGPTILSQLEVAFQEDLGNPDADGSDVVAIDRLYYQFPLGSAFTVTVGGRVGQDDMLAIWPSVYPADTVLDVLTLNGAPGAYNKNLGAGGGIWWQSAGFAISASYVAANGDQADPARGGIATDGAGGTGTVQIGYAAEQWAIAAIYSRIQNGNDLIVYATPLSLASYSQPGVTSAFGLAGYWQPASSRWLPSISAGWGINASSYGSGGAEAVGAISAEPGELVATSQSWSVGLQWLDAFLPGNALGLAVGQPPFATALKGGGVPRDGNYVWEGWYRFQLTDAISLTPALFYLSRPYAQLTPQGESFRQLGGLIKTTFQF